MNCRGWMAFAIVAVGTVVAGNARAQESSVCTEGDLSQGAVQVSLRAGQLGLARSVCAANRVGLGQSGFLLVDLDNFFGNIRTATELQGEYQLSRKTSIFGLLEAYRYETVIASVAAVESGLGHTALGVAHRYFDNSDLGAVFTTRLVLPSPVGLYHNVSSLALDVATGVQWTLRPRLAVHGTLGLLSSVGVARDAAQPRLGTQLTLGMGWQPWRFFGVVTDLVSGFGYAAPIDIVAAALSLRFLPAKRLTVSLDALVPFGGRERALAAGALRLSWAF
jgi:hypothetical protein